MPDSIFRIAVVASGINEEYQNQVLRGAERYAAANAVRLSVFADMGGVLSGADYDAGEYNIHDPFSRRAQTTDRHGARLRHSRGIHGSGDRRRGGCRH